MDVPRPTLRTRNVMNDYRGRKLQTHQTPTNGSTGACLVSGYFGDQGQIKTTSCCILNHQAISHSISGSFFLSSLHCKGCVCNCVQVWWKLANTGIPIWCWRMSACAAPCAPQTQEAGSRRCIDFCKSGWTMDSSLSILWKINYSWFFLVFFLIQYSSLCCIYELN